MKTYSPECWPQGAPAYCTAEGWEHQKRLQRADLISEVSTIPWLLSFDDVRRLEVATRLAEIVKSPDAARLRRKLQIIETVIAGKSPIEFRN